MARKIKKEAATQNSASSMAMSSALDRVADSGGDRLCRRLGTGQALDDGRGSFGSDGLHIGHCRRLGGSDGLLRPGQLGVELGLQLFALALGFGRLFFARLVGERLGASTRFRQCMLIGG